MPEAKLAREAELCYATVAMVTDYDCWHDDHDDVTVEQVIKILFENADKGRALIRALVPRLSERDAVCGQGCHTSLDNALITAPDARDPGIAQRLEVVAGRVLGLNRGSRSGLVRLFRWGIDVIQWMASDHGASVSQIVRVGSLKDV